MLGCVKASQFEKYLRQQVPQLHKSKPIVGLKAGELVAKKFAI